MTQEAGRQEEAVAVVLTRSTLKLARTCVADTYRVQADDEQHPNLATKAWRELRAAIAAPPSSLLEKLEAEVERLRKVERDCTREVERRRDKGQERNVLAEGRVMTAGAAADRLQAIINSERSGNE